MIMIQTPYNLTQDDKRCYLNDGCIHSWGEIEQLILQHFPKHLDLQIPILLLPTIPDYYTPRLATPSGQDNDLGYPVNDGRSIHVKTYTRDGFYRIHWDAKDPKKDPWGHLKEDAPEWLMAIGIGAAVGIGYGVYRLYKRKSKK